MPQVIQTETFRDWLSGLTDRAAVQRIGARMQRMARGNPGDVKPVGGGVSEARIDCGPGYRLYFASKGEALIVLLAGGDKSSQRRDIERAQTLWERWKEDRDE